MPSLRSDLLGIYLNDHLAIATGALALARRAASAEPELSEIVPFVRADRNDLIRLVDRLGLRRTRYKESFAVVGERLGRLKLNGAVRERSPLSSLVELDGLAAAIGGTRACWQSLRSLAGDGSGLDPATWDAAISRTGEALARLDALRPGITRRALHPDA